MTRKAHFSAQTASTKADTIAKTIAMGQSHHNQGHLGLAEACYRQVLSLDANDVNALHLLGVVALQSNKFEDAIRLIKSAASKRPREFPILVNLGAAFRAAGQNAEAVKIYETAIKLNPKSSAVHFNLGKAFMDLGDFEKSIASYARSIALDPKDPDAYINIGNVYKAKGEGDAAIAAYEKALRLTPIATAFGNIGAVLIDRSQFEEALVMLDKALALDPKDSDIKLKRALTALRLARFKEGWSDYEIRFLSDKERIARCPPPPNYWRGEDLGGKTILVSSEQGLGDEILYASLLPDLIARAGRCIFECSARMVPVFKRSFPEATVLAYQKPGQSTTPAAGLDFQTTICSLGQYFRPDFNHFPRHDGYLKADAARVASLRARYEAIAPGHLIVGVSWSSKNQSFGGSKSADLSSWADVLNVPGVTFVNLQYGDCAADLKAVKDALGVDVFHDTEVDPLKDMDAFFAQVAAMDLVITTSNTTVHVAGSLNVPTWLLLPSGSACLWYWFTEREDTPWYPSVKLFRRPAIEPGKKSGEVWWRDGIARMSALLTQRQKPPPDLSTS